MRHHSFVAFLCVGTERRWVGVPDLNTTERLRTEEQTISICFVSVVDVLSSIISEMLMNF